MPELIWSLGGPRKMWATGGVGLGRGLSAIEFDRGWIHVPRWFPLGPHLESSLSYYQIYALWKYDLIFRDEDVRWLHELPEVPDDEHGALVVGGAANHWHLLNDCVARLALPALRPELRRRTLLVSDDLPPAQQAVLEFFLERHGWGAPVRRLSEGYHRLRRTIVPGRVLPHAVGAIYRSILDVPTDPNDHGPKNLFVRRDHAKRRLVVNQDELQSALEPMGFVALDPGALPFRKQVAWFRRARRVVAVHGAAMANLLFAPRGGRVLELYGGDAQLFYRDVARAGGHWFRRERLTAVEGSQHFVIDTARVIDIVREWF